MQPISLWNIFYDLASLLLQRKNEAVGALEKRK